MEPSAAAVSCDRDRRRAGRAGAAPHARAVGAARISARLSGRRRARPVARRTGAEVRAMSTALAFRDVTRSYRSGLPGALSRVDALRGVQLEVAAGECL